MANTRQFAHHLTAPHSDQHRQAVLERRNFAVA